MNVKDLFKAISAKNKAKTGYSLYSYTNNKGDFNYDLYKKIQEEGNKRKIDRSWTTEQDINFLADYIKNEKQDITFGICHGTRKGLEQQWFSEALKCPVVGTEISETATQFPNTIQWDFHEIKEEWKNSADFIYSNSFDHSYNPEKAINSWMDALKDDGVCILEHSINHTPDAVSELDPFGAVIDIMPYLIIKWSQNKFSVREILTSPHEREGFGFVNYLIIKKN